MTLLFLPPRARVHSRADSPGIEQLMLLATIDWRESFGVDDIVPAAVRSNGETGKVFVCGPDMSGQPVLLMRPGRENARDDHDGNLRHLVYQLERAVSCMDEDAGVGKMTVILDLYNYSSSNAPPMRTSVRHVGQCDKGATGRAEQGVPQEHTHTHTYARTTCHSDSESFCSAPLWMFCRSVEARVLLIASSCESLQCASAVHRRLHHLRD